MNRVAVVVLNWNGAALLPPCLESLLVDSAADTHVIVVDNGSTDNSRSVLDELSARFSKRLEVIYNHRNSGFAGGVNVGIRSAIKAGCDAVALFNNDAVAKPGWLSALTAVLDARADVGITTGLLLHEDGQTIDSSGDYYSIWGLAFPRGRDEPTASAPAAGYVFGATGGASLYRVAMLQEIGFFDEDFFAYYEDVDLSFRAQLAGWTVYYEPKAVALHKRGATSGTIPGFGKYQMFKNLPQLFWKNVPRGLVWRIGWRFKFVYIVMLLNAVLQGMPLVALRGLGTGIYYGLVAITKRGYVQSLKKVSVEYIDSLIYQDLPPNQKGRLRKLVGAGHNPPPTT